LRSDSHDLDERRELRVGCASAAIFLILLLAAGYFHQGGGWNQNARFNQIRAIVETGSLAIDDYLLYGLERTTCSTASSATSGARFDTGA
jgi:hypothetical protein